MQLSDQRPTVRDSSGNQYGKNNSSIEEHLLAIYSTSNFPTSNHLFLTPLFLFDYWINVRLPQLEFCK